MSVENLKEIIRRLEEHKLDIKREIKKTGDPVGYYEDKICQINVRIEKYKHRLERRKDGLCRKGDTD